MNRRPRRDDELGSASLELAILAPFLIAVLLLIVAFGRYAQTENIVDQASRDGARAATAQNTKADAEPAADKVMVDAMRDAPSSCRDSAKLMKFATTKNAFGLPDPNDPTAVDSVTVTVGCTLDMSDLTALSLGDVHIERTFTSPLDRYRGYQ